MSGSGKCHGEGNGNPLQYSCQGNSLEQRNLADYRPWDPKELGTTEQLTHTHTDTDTQTQTHTHTDTHTPAHTHRHRHRHTDTQTHTHTHTHTNGHSGDGHIN